MHQTNKGIFRCKNESSNSITQSLLASSCILNFYYPQLHPNCKAVFMLEFISRLLIDL